MLRQIEAMLKDAREGNTRIERAEKAILEATEWAKQAEEKTKKANAQAGTSERAVVGTTSGKGEPKRELIVKQKQFAGLEESVSWSWPKSNGSECPHQGGRNETRWNIREGQS